MCVTKMVCGKAVCGRWCVTKMFCVRKMVCDKGVCVCKMVCDKVVCVRKLVCDNVMCDTRPEPAQCHKCHTCYAKQRWLSPSATPAT